ncbi:hypothetical protein AB6D11_00875 [Vibrio splendidus]
MTMKRYFIKETGMALVHFNHYSKTESVYQALKEQLMSDHPELNMTNIEVAVFEGDKRRGQLYAMATVSQAHCDYYIMPEFQCLL